VTRKIIQIAAFGLLLLQPSALLAQYDDHLFPEDGPFSEMLFDYLNDVRRILTRGMRDAPLAYMACLQSFLPEWAVYIQQPQPNPDKPYPLGMLSCFVVCEQADTQIWETVIGSIQSDPDIRSHIKTTVTTRRIPTADANLVVRAFLAVLAKTRYSGARPVSFDGVSYHFTARDPSHGLLMCGQAHDPQKDSTPGMLVALGKTMAEYSRCTDNGTADSLLTRMREIADRLTK
jgi:hypothetical protein